MPRDRLDADELDKYLHVLEACHTDAQVDRLVSWLDSPAGPGSCLRCGATTRRPDRRLPDMRGLGICPDCGNTREPIRTLSDLLSDRPRTPKKRACSSVTVLRTMDGSISICADCGDDHESSAEPPPDLSWIRYEQVGGVRLPAPSRPSPFRPPEYR